MSENPRPRLGASILRGLVSLAAHVEAGACDDYMGHSVEQMKRLGDLEGVQEWDDVQAACAYIWKLKSWDRVKREQKTKNKPAPKRLMDRFDV